MLNYAAASLDKFENTKAREIRRNGAVHGVHRCDLRDINHRYVLHFSSYVRKTEKVDLKQGRCGAEESQLNIFSFVSSETTLQFIAIWIRLGFEDFRRKQYKFDNHRD
jgi:hypothetical protein